MKQIPVAEAVGMVLGHDLTKIVPGQFKGCAFKKGHIIREEDIPELLQMGKKHIYIVEIAPGTLHEDSAAARLATALAGSGTGYGEPSEGKINIKADCDGLFKVNRERLFAMLKSQDLSIATIHNNTQVFAGDILAGCRVIPLVVAEATITEAEKQAAEGGPVLQVVPFAPRVAAVIATGSEIAEGRIEDRFTPVVLEKLRPYPAKLLEPVVSGDEKEEICAGILGQYAAGAQLIIVTGGMSVDPDDRTPAAIHDSGAEVITYGAPVLPGSMFMLAYLGDVPVVGLPGCVMYNKTTVFDLILPRLFAGERLEREDFIEMSVGGLCANCEQCHYPNCRYGKC